MNTIIDERFNETGTNYVTYAEFQNQKLSIFEGELKDNTATFCIKILLVVVGLMGNVTSIAVFTRKHMISSVNILLTALETTNLFMFLSNIPDFAEFVNMDFSFTYVHVIMEITAINVESVVNFASNWLTVTIGLWRLIAVRFPLKVEIWCSKKRAVKIITSLMIFSVLYTVPQVFLFACNGKSYVIRDTNPASTMVIYKVVMSGFAQSNDDRPFKIVTGMLLVTTALPSFVLFMVTSFLVLALWSARRRRASMRGEQPEVSREQRITVTLLVLLLLFLVAYVPDSIFNILYQTNSIPLDSKPSCIEWFVTTKIPVILCNASTFFFYYYMSDRFRDTFKKIILSRSIFILDKVRSSTGLSDRFSTRSTATLETELSLP